MKSARTEIFIINEFAKLMRDINLSNDEKDLNKQWQELQNSACAIDNMNNKIEEGLEQYFLKLDADVKIASDENSLLKCKSKSIELRGSILKKKEQFKELFAKDDKENEIWIEGFNESLEKREKQIDNLINAIDTNLEILKRDNISKYTESKQTSCFKTTLSRDERLIVCDKIIADKGGKIEAGIDKRLFIGIEEKHKPTLMYLLGGECPPKIIKLNMVSHPKMYKYLLGYSAHYYNGIKCLPVKIRENFLPKLLNDNKGKRITKLNNNIEPNNK